MNVPWITELELRQLRTEAQECESDCDECHLIKLLANQCEVRDQEIAQLRQKLDLAWTLLNEEPEENHHVLLGWSPLLRPY